MKRSDSVRAKGDFLMVVVVQVFIPRCGNVRKGREGKRGCIYEEERKRERKRKRKRKRRENAEEGVGVVVSWCCTRREKVV